jgi:hypothetical protein
MVSVQTSVAFAYWVQPSTTRKKVRATAMIVSNVFAYVSMALGLDALIAVRHGAPVSLIDRLSRDARKGGA